MSCKQSSDRGEVGSEVHVLATDSKNDRHERRNSLSKSSRVPVSCPHCLYHTLAQSYVNSGCREREGSRAEGQRLIRKKGETGNVSEGAQLAERERARIAKEGILSIICALSQKLQKGKLSCDESQIGQIAKMAARFFRRCSRWKMPSGKPHGQCHPQLFVLSYPVKPPLNSGRQKGRRRINPRRYAAAHRGNVVFREIP